MVFSIISNIGIEIDNEANVANDLAFIGPVLRRAFNKDIANKR